MNAEVEFARRRMIREHLSSRDIRDTRVLAALVKVPRERFVPSVEPAEAYADCAWPIDCGQTISQPYIVALMTQALELSGVEKVLEIGTGSGYQCAVLAELAARVVSIERHAPLSEQAAEVLQALGYQNIQLVVGDGTQGYPAEAPYDRIIVTAAGGQIPPPLWEQLAEGGFLVIPVGDSSQQFLQRVRKVKGEPQVEYLCPVRFVPLVGAEPK